MKAPKIVKERPAETRSVGLGVLVGAVIAWRKPPAEVAGLMTAGAGAAAAVFTYLNTHGGLLGVIRRLLRGDG